MYLTRLYGTETGLSFASWMAIGVPVALATTLLAWVLLLLFFASYLKYLLLSFTNFTNLKRREINELNFPSEQIGGRRSKRHER